MSDNRSSVAPGMKVIGSDGNTVGEIKEVQGADMVVSRALPPPVKVPLKTVREVTADAVMLSVTGEQIDDQFWAHAGEDLSVDTSGTYD